MQIITIIFKLLLANSNAFNIPLDVFPSFCHLSEYYS